jgi:hypothetical protein
LIFFIKEQWLGFKFLSLLSLGRPFGTEPKSPPRLGGRGFKFLSLLSLGRPFGTEPKSPPRLGGRGFKFSVTLFCPVKEHPKDAKPKDPSLPESVGLVEQHDRVLSAGPQTNVGRVW